MDYVNALFDAMRAAPQSGISGDDPDELLGGDPLSLGQPGVGRLLAAAAAPAQPGELANESVAVSALVRAFRDSAAQSDAPQPVRGTRTLLTRAAAVKIMAVGAVLALGGTAVAAQTGGLPDPVQQRAHELFAPFGVPQPAPPSPGQTTRTPSARPTNSATSDLVSLCRIWVRARDDATHGRTIDPAVRRALANAAGGESKISGYCDALPGVTASPSSTGAPATPSGHPTGNGNGNGSSSGGNGNGNGWNGNGNGGNGNGKPSARPTPSPHRRW